MATLDAKKRASLPNSAFAYVDSQGNRRLPINDEGHVRNALSRFNQVKFENEEARERAFRRLLKAATDYGIAPIGFVTRQLREARGADPSDLPSGAVTLLLTDIEGSTQLVQDLGEKYQPVLERVRTLIRDAVGAHEGYEVDSRADEFFAVFADAGDGIATAIEIQQAMHEAIWPGGHRVKVRIGLNSGSPAVTDTGYVGLPVNVMARVCNAGHGGQILLTDATRGELGGLAKGIELESLGAFRLQGLPEPEALFQVRAPGLSEEFPPLRVVDQT
ncbi:MAG TPA: adenylate/guanylate cyclase domain-containing protein [Acidimicrobiia bacterium]|nr:adenylate/guanylate cyclase domain-containing protein [Acidimicrobiia bacterium]